MTTLDKIREHWPIPTGPSPVEIPNVTRDDFAHLLAALDFNYGVEVGTEQGIYAEVLCKANLRLALTCVDPYKAYKAYRDHTSQQKLDDFYDEARFRLKDYNVTFIREPSVNAAQGFSNNSLDFVYLDGNHALPFIIADLDAWVPKIRPGGIIAGHDFIRRNNRLRYQCHVVEAVYAYTQCYMVDPWYVLGTKDELPGQKRDIIRSFMWIKQ